MSGDFIWASKSEGIIKLDAYLQSSSEADIQLIANKSNSIFKVMFKVRCRELLDVPQREIDRSPKDGGETWQELLLRLTGRDVSRCPQCKTGKMETSMEIFPSLPPWELPGRGAVA